MNILVVYAHHEPGSLVASLKNVGVSTMQSMGHEVYESDLYGIGFHPIANKYDFDIKKIMIDKIEKNAFKYPVNKARGNAKKYTEL